MSNPITPDQPLTAPQVSGNPAAVTLSAERLVGATEWVESGHVRLRRRVVSETRTIEIVVRREELIIELRDVAAGQVGESYLGTNLDGPTVPPPLSPVSPLVVLLSEEVPEVFVRPRVYQRVTAQTVLVAHMAVVADVVRHEEAVLQQLR